MTYPLRLLLSALLAFSLACSDDAPNANANNANNANNTNNANNANNGPVDMSGDASSMDVGVDASADTSADASPGDMAEQPDLPFEVNDMGQVLCGSKPCACSDGKDNDGDGEIDGFDPECTGPYDDDESTFATGISGDNKDPNWQDCFFDGNSGSGDDKCRYHTDCLTGDAGPDDPRCQVSDTCRNNCQKFAPNGCDCFGCCTLFRDDGSSKSVVIGTECSLAKIDDESVCTSCVPTTACGNACGECELCPGRSAADLPDKCRPTETPDMDMGTNDMGPSDMGEDDMGTPPDGPGYTCEGGAEVCSLSDRCSVGYCLQGCCADIPQ